MTVFSRPKADATNPGTWVAVGGPSTLWQALNDSSPEEQVGGSASTPDDADYVESPSAPANAEFSVNLGTLLDPASSSGHVVRFRYAKSASAGRTIGITFTLQQGTTQIATTTVSNVSNTPTTGSLTLSGAEADAITDYGQLRLLVSANQTGTGAARTARVYWAEFEVPGSLTMWGPIASALQKALFSGTAQHVQKGPIAASLLKATASLTGISGPYGQVAASTRAATFSGQGGKFPPTSVQFIQNGGSATDSTTDIFGDLDATITGDVAPAGSNVYVVVFAYLTDPLTAEMKPSGATGLGPYLWIDSGTLYYGTGPWYNNFSSVSGNNPAGSIIFFAPITAGSHNYQVTCGTAATASNPILNIAVSYYSGVGGVVNSSSFWTAGTEAGTSMSTPVAVGSNNSRAVVTFGHDSSTAVTWGATGSSRWSLTNSNGASFRSGDAAGPATVTATRASGVDYSVLAIDLQPNALGPLTATLQAATAALTGKSGGRIDASLQKATAALSGTGQSGVTGTMGASLQTATSSASGGQKQTGSIAAAIPAVTAVMEGLQPGMGAVAAALQRVLFSGAGIQKQAGSIAASATPATAALTAAHRYIGTLAAAAQAATAALVGTPKQVGAVSAAMQFATASLTAVMQPEGFMAATAQPHAAALVGTPKQVGSVSAAMQPATTALSGYMHATGTVSATLQAATLSGTGNQFGAAQTMQVNLRHALFSAVAESVYEGTAAATAQSATAEFHTFAGNFGDIEASLQPATAALVVKQVYVATIEVTARAATASVSATQAYQAGLVAALSPPLFSANGAQLHAGTAAPSLTPAVFNGAGGQRLSATMIARLQPATVATPWQAVMHASGSMAATLRRALYNSFPGGGGHPPIIRIYTPSADQRLFITPGQVREYVVAVT